MTTAMEYLIKKRTTLVRENHGISMLEKMVLPLMPHTLEECFDANYLSIGYDNPPKDLRIDFIRKQGTEMDLAYGTITKMQEALVKDGWTVLSPSTLMFGKEALQVQLAARKELESRPLDLTIVFENLAPTDNCRLVEKEVWVEEVPAVKAHTETKMGLVCNGEESDDNSANVG